MRDDSYLESEVEAESSAATWRGRTATAVGALMSLAILAGVVIWSYRLGVRDAAEIPVIRAELGATKERPEEPGGVEVDYQGRAVYDVVSGETEAATTASGYAEPPARLSDEDVAAVKRSPEPAPRPDRAGEAGATAEGEATEGDAAAAPEGETDATPADPAAMTPPPAPPPVEVGDDGAVADADTATEGAEEAQTLEQQVADAIAAVTAEEAAETDADLSRLAPSQAPTARPRPVRLTTPAVATPTETPEPVEAASASRVQIQLGAFTSQDIANAQWDQIRSRNGDLLSGRGRVVTPVQSGGRQLWRLRAGPFASIEEASALCRGLKARNEACIVARSRN